MAKRSRVSTMFPLVLDQEDDLELWEVVNPSDGEYSDDSFSIDSISDDDVISLDNASVVSTTVISPPNQILPGADGGDLTTDLDLGGNVDSDSEDEGYGRDLAWFQQRMVILGGGSRYSYGITYGDNVNDERNEDRGVEDGDYEYSYDLDDELVPRNVSRKLGRERLRKLAKRGISKVFTSKTTPYSQLKPGCVHDLILKKLFLSDENQIMDL